MNKLWLRLSLSFLGATLLVIGAVAWVVRESVESSFSQYVTTSNKTRIGTDLLTEIEAYYVNHEGWVGVDSLLPKRGHGEGAVSATDETRGAQIYIADVDHVIVAATMPDWVNLNTDEIGPSRQIELTADGQTIGILGEQTPGTVALNEAESRFSNELTTGLILTGLGGGLVTFALGILLSYSLTRPLQHLTNHVSRLKLRGLQTEITVGGTDEIQRLGTAFNDLLGRIAAGEAQRQRMSADIAHELRTPVTVMRGHLEAMMDGVYPLDTPHLAVAYDQVLHLARLVEDLRLLTQAEAGRLPLKPVQLDVLPMVQTTIERFRPLIQDRNLTITSDVPSTETLVIADPHRLQQVFDNLLSNAIRHVPDAGHIAIRVWQAEGIVSVSIFNQSTEALNDEQVAHLFERFWRGEEARERDTGGSGLGLAITRELLRLQGGTIAAAYAENGVRVTFTLPAKGNTQQAIVASNA